MVLINDDDVDAAADSLFSFGEQLLFDNEEDQSAAMNNYEIVNGEEYNLNQADGNCSLDDCSSSIFPPKTSEYQSTDTPY